MRFLLTLIILATAAWSGYWVLASRTAHTAFESWFEDRRAQGWVAEYEALGVAGFPNRIDTSLTGVALADPGTGLAWEAPFFQVLALSYKPNHVIAVWPNTQLVATPYSKFRLQSTDMRASLVLEPTTSLTVDRATLTAEGLAFGPVETEQTGRIAGLRLAAERVAVDEAPTYRLGVFANGLVPSMPWRAHLDPAGALPDSFEALRADVTVTFDAPWDRHAIETARPQPRKIKVKLADAQWGQLQLQIAGEVDVDAQGVPDGSLTVKARNWREILQLGVNSGAVPSGLADTLEDGLTLVAGLAGNPRTLDIPLDFRRGRVFLGPIPIGAAPVLRLR